jgi:hypothetical protein
VRNLFNYFYGFALLNNSEVKAWQKALLLPTVLLSPPKSKSTLSSLAQYISLLDNDDWSSIKINSFAARSSGRINPKTSRESRVNKLVSLGEFHRAYQALISTATPASGGSTVVDKLRELHPVRKEPDHPLYSDPISDEFRADLEPFNVSPQDAYRLILSSRSGVAPGPDGLRNEHVRQLAGSFRSPDEVKFVETYAAILTHIANGSLPSPVLKYLAGAELFALQDGAKVRPLALGCTWRKDATKVVTQSAECKEICKSHLFPLQVGVGVKNGIEVAINSIRLSFENDPTKHIFKTDNRNAFNSMERTIILEEVKNRCPSAYPLISSMLKPEALLWNVSDSTISVIESSAGSQQGDVAGGLVYSIGLQPFLIGLFQLLKDNGDNPNLPSILKSYIDDGILHLSTDQLLLALRHFYATGPDYGVYLRKDKVSILLGQFGSDFEALNLQEILTSPEGDFNLNSDKVHIHPINGGYSQFYGINLLGSPIGCDDFIVNFLQCKIASLSIECEKLIALENSQVKFLLLHYCFSKKIQHLLRTVDPKLTIEHLVSPFNCMLQRVVESITFSSLTQREWDQCLLSINNGGLGIGNDHVVAHAAYAASILSTATFLREVVPSFNDIIQRNDLSLPTILAFDNAIRIINYKNYDASQALSLVEDDQLSTDKLQATLLEEYKNSAFDKHKQSVSNSPKLLASLLAVASPEASSFLLAKPNLYNLRLNTSEYAIAIIQRLRKELPIPSNLNCNCSQHASIDKYGDHLTTCKKGQEIYITHNTMVNTIAALCKHSGLQVRIEPPNLFAAIDDHQKLRPDLEIIGLEAQPIFLDVGITHSIPQTLSANQATQSGRLANAYAHRKHCKYDENAMSVNSKFIPIIIETKGCWQSEFKSFFNTVIQHNNRTSGIPIAALKAYWMRRISATLQRTIARGILSKTKRIYSPTFFDEANYSGAIMVQADNIFLDFDPFYCSSSSSREILAF